MHSEFDTKPNAIIVHNPIKTGSLNLVKKRKEDTFLFLQKPNIKKFGDEYKNFIKQLKKNDVNVVELLDILKKSSQYSQFLHLVAANPNQVYTRDAMITFPWASDKCIISNMRMPVRRLESTVMREISKIIGLKEIIQLPPDVFLEGGDLIPLSYNNKKVFIVAYGVDRGATKSALYFLKDKLIPNFIDEIVGIEIASYRMNLDDGFVPISNNFIVCHPQSLTSGIQLTENQTKKIDPLSFFEKLGFSIIKVRKDDSIFNQACNILCLDKHKIIMYNSSDSVNKKLKELPQFTTIAIDSKELVKGRGGCRCMTRSIYKDFIL